LCADPKQKNYSQDEAKIVTQLQYLLFLRRTKDNQFEPVSGIIRVQYAIRELHRAPSGEFVRVEGDK
jgi:hypothetical protein